MISKFHFKALSASAVIFLMATSSINANAQTMTLGPKAGYGMASWWGTDASKPKWVPSYNAGLFFLFSNMKHHGFGVEALYEVKGVKADYSINGVSGSNWIKTTYIQIPLTYNYFFGSNENIKPKLFAGPNVGIFLGRQSKMAKDDDYSASTKEGYESVDLGFVAGGGVNIRVGTKNWLNVDLRFEGGLTKFFVDPPVPGGTKNIYARAASRNIGYGFGLGGGSSK